MWWVFFSFLHGSFQLLDINTHIFLFLLSRSLKNLFNGRWRGRTRYRTCHTRWWLVLTSIYNGKQQPFSTQHHNTIDRSLLCLRDRLNMTSLSSGTLFFIWHLKCPMIDWSHTLRNTNAHTHSNNTTSCHSRVDSFKKDLITDCQVCFLAIIPLSSYINSIKWKSSRSSQVRHSLLYVSYGLCTLISTTK